MMAIDRTEEGDLQVWLQVAIPGKAGSAPSASGIGGGGAGGGGLPYFTLSGRGKTILDAARSIQLQLPRRLFFAHMRVILIGERLAREGLRPALDFMTRHPQLRLTDYILLLRGSVPDLMAVQVNLERLPGEYLREISRSRVGTVVTLGDFTRMLAEEGADPVLGEAEVIPPRPGAPEGQTPSLKLKGTALFRDDKLVGHLSERESRGLLWMRAENQRGIVSAEVPGTSGSVSMEWTLSHVRRRVQMDRGRVTVHIDIRVEGNVFENQANVDLSDPTAIRTVEKEINQAISDYMQSAWNEMRRLNVDSAGFGELVSQQLPAVWRQVKPRWMSREFSRVGVVFSVDAQIRRTGLSNKSRAWPE